MPLFVRLAINDDEIEELKITRLNSDFIPDPDMVYDYQVRRWAGNSYWPIGKVEHRYGNGAAALAIEALELLDERTTTTNPVSTTE